MEHYVYAVRSSSRAPTGDGDTLSWLNYYKLNPEAGETYIPFPASGKDAVAGDQLWFVVDQRLVARVNVLRARSDEMNNGQIELWYDAAQIRPLSAPTIESPITTGPLGAMVGEIWLGFVD